MIGQIFDAKEFNIKLKATIQLTGKLGFSLETIKKLCMKPNYYVIIAPDTDDPKTFYMCVTKKKTKKGFKIYKGGEYVFLQTKQLFDKLFIDYTKKSIIMDMYRYEDGDKAIGGVCYRMKMR